MELLGGGGMTTLIRNGSSGPGGVDGDNNNIGAKRRKPLKTNKVTQQHEENHVHSIPQILSSSPPRIAPLHDDQSRKGSNQQHEDSPDPIRLALPSFTPTLGTTTLVQPISASGDTRIYRCPQCQILLNSQKEFTAHIRGHNEVKPHPDPNDPTGQAKVYYCCLCGKMLSSFSSLDRHMLVHSGERPFSCTLCGQTFTTNGNMHRHKRTHIANRGGSTTNNENGLETPPRRVGRKRKTSEERQRQGLKGQKNGEKILLHTSAFNNNSPLLCPICEEPYFSEISLESHIISIHPGVEMKCSQCEYKSMNYGYFKAHRSVFHQSFNNNKQSSNKSSFPSSTDLSCSSQFPQLTKALTHLEESKKKEEELAAKEPPSKIPKSEESEDDSSSVNNPSMSDNDPYIKDMKLKGEFPCRLCPAIYPNLRALKGHNKEHLGKAPYVCNVGACVYSSSDKMALTRHMRGHTGEKPYECKICSYEFTTKANCERHLRNKHGKCSRDNIRDSIAVHENHKRRTSYRCKVCKTTFPSSVAVVEHALKEHPAYSDDANHIYEEVVVLRALSSDDEEDDMEDDYDFEEEENASLACEEAKNLLPPEEAPLDLSQNKNKPQPSEDSTCLLPSSGIPPLFPSGFPYIIQQHPSAIRPSFPFIFPHMSGAAAAAAAVLMGGNPALDNAEWMKHRLVQTNPFGFNPLCCPQQQPHTELKVPPPPAPKPEANDEKAAVEALQRLSATPKKTPSLQQPLLIPKLSSSGNQTISPVSPPPPPVSESNTEQQNSAETDLVEYKMVIKNGVLMKKQKQRRYRTERPYGCQHCSARFTLRSNMERHIKQQHPDHWCQKPRGNRRHHSSSSSRTPERSEEEGKMTTKLVIDEEFKEDEDELVDLEPEESLHILKDDGLASVSKLLNTVSKRQMFPKLFDPGDDSEAGLIKTLKCPYCRESIPWTSSSAFRSHLSANHLGGKCAECCRWLSSREEFDKHCKQEHGQLLPPSEDEINNLQFSCPVCEVSPGFSKREDGLLHLQINHSLDYEAWMARGVFKGALNDGDEPCSSSSSEETQHSKRCSLCAMGFSSNNELKKHFLEHLGSLETCLDCGFLFTLHSAYERHRKKVHEEPPHLTLASAKFKKRANLMDKINKLSISIATGGGGSSSTSKDEYTSPSSSRPLSPAHNGGGIDSIFKKP